MEKTVGRCCVAVEWGSGEYEQIVLDAQMTVAICGLKFIRFCWNDSNQTVLDFLKYYYLVFHYFSSDGCCSVM